MAVLLRQLHSHGDELAIADKELECEYCARVVMCTIALRVAAGSRWSRLPSARSLDSLVAVKLLVTPQLSPAGRAISDLTLAYATRSRSRLRRIPQLLQINALLGNTVKREIAENDELAGIPDHPSAATSWSNLGFAYWEVGRTAEAIALLERTLEARKRLLGRGTQKRWPRRTISNSRSKRQSGPKAPTSMPRRTYQEVASEL